MTNECRRHTKSGKHIGKETRIYIVFLLQADLFIISAHVELGDRDKIGPVTIPIEFYSAFDMCFAHDAWFLGPMISSNLASARFISPGEVMHSESAGRNVNPNISNMILHYPTVSFNGEWTRIGC